MAALARVLQRQTGVTATAVATATAAGTPLLTRVFPFRLPVNLLLELPQQWRAPARHNTNLCIRHPNYNSNSFARARLAYYTTRALGMVPEVNTSTSEPRNKGSAAANVNNTTSTPIAVRRGHAGLTSTTTTTTTNAADGFFHIDLNPLLKRASGRRDAQRQATIDQLKQVRQWQLSRRSGSDIPGRLSIWWVFGSSQAVMELIGMF